MAGQKLALLFFAASLTCTLRGSIVPSKGNPPHLRVRALRGGQGEASPDRSALGAILTADGVQTPGPPIGGHVHSAGAMSDECQDTDADSNSEAEVAPPTQAALSLWAAAKEGDEEKIQLLLRDGQVDVDVQDPRSGDWAALHYAAHHGRGRALATLLRFGAQVDVRNDRENTPLALAAAEGHLLMVQKLFGAGGRVDAANIYGSTPLHGAASSGCTKTCDLPRPLALPSLAAALPPSALGQFFFGAAHCARAAPGALLVKLGADVNATNTMGVAALHFAAAAGHEDTVEHLLELGAHLHAANRDGWTALHYAAQQVRPRHAA